jgi:hypothetical protein
VGLYRPQGNLQTIRNFIAFKPIAGKTQNLQLPQSVQLPPWAIHAAHQYSPVPK